MGNNKSEYGTFCLEHPDIPIFSQPWWLDTVCPDKWDVLLLKRNNKIIASFPYYLTKTRRVFSHIMMPPLTQKMGPYIIYDKNKQSESKKINYEHEIYGAFIKMFPKHLNFTVCFDWKYKNWLPFYWNGFKQTTRYTYLINNIKNHDLVQSNYSKSKKQPLLKARDTLSLKFDLPPDDFYRYFSEVIYGRNKDVSFDKNFFQNLYSEIYSRESGRVLYCTDRSGNIQAINMVVWDSECAYYLIAMRKKEYNTSGGTEFLVDETIKYVSQFVDTFDFEGSMIKGVEESYRHYGSRQVGYYEIRKCNSILLRVKSALKNS